MNSILLAAFLLFSPVCQIINAQQFSFDDLASKFNTKVDAIDTNMRLNCSFILKSLGSNDFSNIELKLNAPLNPLLSNDKLEALVTKVPEGVKLKKTNVRDFLRSKIETFNNKQIENRNLLDQIWAEVTVDVSRRMDDLFLKSFVQWEKNSVDINHMKKVISNLTDAIVEFDEMNKVFGEQLEAADMARISIEEDISSSAMVFNKLLKKSKLTTSIIIEEVVPIFSVIFQKLAEFESIIQKENALTKEFNNRRIVWADYMIGVRETLSAERKLVKPYKKTRIAKNLAKLGILCGNEENHL
ncbi:uncharacterized protein LOC116341839 [Contarinia nasturtii]|uniref:uncharacterized protein LOC116341839 n=1 Tax=Contarinia nasturtii TaxID=265458 RepID=UPI0012D4033D|nr:uncharacterized protein LOC116341839 [Contarinia nasturtii]